MIRVVNKRTHRATLNDYYIGRPGILGNPATHLETRTLAQVKVDTRNEACDYYERYFNQQIKVNSAFIAEFNKLVTLAKMGDLNLICWCAPERCHGETLKQKIEQALAGFKLY